MNIEGMDGVHTIELPWISREHTIVFLKVLLQLTKNIPCLLLYPLKRPLCFRSETFPHNLLLQCHTYMTFHSNFILQLLCSVGLLLLMILKYCHCPDHLFSQQPFFFFPLVQSGFLPQPIHSVNCETHKLNIIQAKPSDVHSFIHSVSYFFPSILQNHAILSFLCPILFSSIISPLIFKSSRLIS